MPGDSPASRSPRPRPAEQRSAGTTSAGGPRLLIRDAGEQICVGFDQLDLDGGDCGSPPVNSHQGDGLYVDPRRGIVAGVYPAQVTAVDVRFSDGGTVRIPAAEGLGYTGRYRATIHFALAPIPPGRTPTGAALLDATGREIGEVSPDGPGVDATLVGRPSTVLSVGSGRAAVRLVAGATATPLAQRRFPCIGVELGRERGPCDDDFDVIDVNTVTARATCGRRRTIVFGIARRAVPRVEITLADGRRVRPRLAAFPRGLCSTARVFLAVFPRRVAVTRVRFIGHHPAGGSDSVALPMRPPARQCGYEASGALF